MKKPNLFWSIVFAWVISVGLITLWFGLVAFYPNGFSKPILILFSITIALSIMIGIPIQIMRKLTWIEESEEIQGGEE